MRLPACDRHVGPAEHSWTICFAIALIAAGCGRPSAEKSLQQAFRDNPKAQRVELVKFEGTVTVDGQPPGKPDTQLFVILNDPQHPEDPAKIPKLIGGCDDAGHFAFGTYTAHDGVEAGSYVVTFVQLHHPKGIFGHRTQSLFKQPDELKNLYNDPDKNAKDPQFKVELTPPGKTDWNFNLDVAGKDPVTTPGPHAMTKLDYR